MAEMVAPGAGAPPPAAEGGDQGGNQLEELLSGVHSALAAMAKATEGMPVGEKWAGLLSAFDGLAKETAQGGNAQGQPSEGAPGRAPMSQAPAMVGGAKQTRPLM